MWITSFEFGPWALDLGPWTLDLLPYHKIPKQDFSSAVNDHCARGGAGNIQDYQIAEHLMWETPFAQGLADFHPVSLAHFFEVCAAVGLVHDQVFWVKGGLDPVDGESVAGFDPSRLSNANVANIPSGHRCRIIFREYDRGGYSGGGLGSESVGDNFR